MTGASPQGRCKESVTPLLIPATMASLLGGVVNAWLFLVKVTG
jgi:membrane protein YqaA with SNARE-associated domain